MAIEAIILWQVTYAAEKKARTGFCPDDQPASSSYLATDFSDWHVCKDREKVATVLFASASESRPPFQAFGEPAVSGYNLTLCISTRLRIACFRPDDRIASKNGMKISNRLSCSSIAKSLHFKERFHPAFPCRRRPQKHPPFPPHACGGFTARASSTRRTHKPEPPHACSDIVPMRHPPSCDT